MLASFMSLYIPPVLIVLAVGCERVWEDCGRGWLYHRNTEHYRGCGGGGGEHSAGTLARELETGDGSQSVTADGSPQLSSPASTHPVSSLSIYQHNFCGTLNIKIGK